mmetsp:Transcript_18427/g.45665  ORF Transcript_18427/g.45665 Transcript_18427/m.45665 type:complete len:128 (-) Transcript_18427:111-494(-)
MNPPSKTDFDNGNYTYPNNSVTNSLSATMLHQRTYDSQNRTGNNRSGDHHHDETANNRLQQSLWVPSALPPLRMPRGGAANNFSVEQQRKRTIDIIDEALGIINGKHDDEEGESLFNLCLSHTFPQQ